MEKHRIEAISKMNDDELEIFSIEILGSLKYDNIEFNKLIKFFREKQ
jgi:hypothetical protein